MSKDAKNVPALRFKGYSDAWEKRKLGEVATITMGQSPDSKNYTLNPQDHILVQGNADIKNGWVEPRVWTTQITKIAKKGSVLLSVRAPVGEVSKTAFDVVLGRGVASVGQTDFLYQYLITLKINGFWLRYSTGSTFDSINSADIKDAIIFLPEKNEQSRIAKTLNCIDNLIAATQHNIDALEQAKKALLQRLFDQSWRFKGYSDPWEKRKLGEVATITMGQSPDSKNYTLNPQDHILVQGNADIKNGWVEPRVWTTQITKIAKKGSVLLSVRAPVGEVSKTAFDVVLGRGVASVGQTDFLYQYLITLKINGFWLRYSTGSTFDSINSADIKDAIIFLPEKNEQSRIAKTLNCIDNLIAATQSRLSSLELLKKALLQDLFI